MSIASTRRYVPFDPDWYNMEDRIIMGGLKDEMWKAYPAIKTCDGSPVAQWEKMVRIEEGGGSRLLV
jgi:methionine aminopeptidase